MSLFYGQMCANHRNLTSFTDTTTRLRVVSSPAPKRAVSENGNNNPLHKRQHIQDDDAPQQPVKINGFRPINLPSYGKANHAVSAPTTHNGEILLPSPMDSPAAHYPGDTTDSDDDQQTDAEPDDHSTSCPPMNSQQPYPNETMIAYCLRMSYIPPTSSVPTTKLIQPFLSLRPIRPLDYNPECRSRLPWQPGQKTNQNWFALFTQIAGRVAPRACEKCARGQAKWLPCVLAVSEETSVNGACGCCLYNNVGSKCSFVKGGYLVFWLVCDGIGWIADQCTDSFWWHWHCLESGDAFS